MATTTERGASSGARQPRSEPALAPLHDNPDIAPRTRRTPSTLFPVFMQSAVILVVERDPHVRELEAYFLERAGYAVEFAADGAEALDMVKRVTPDIVITEVLVPKLDGLALTRHIKAARETAHTRVLVFSILAVAERAREAGADAFLRKPLAEQTLVQTVTQLLERESEISP